MKIAPSILSADFAALGEEIARVEAGGADQLHVDVMDGRFVPNITIGPMVVEAIRKRTRLPLDVHLMIVEPDRYVEAFVRAGADAVTIHAEADPHLQRTLAQIRELGAKGGVALNPATPPDVLQHVLDDLDLVLVMSVNPGFGGQRFIPAVLPKVRQVRTLLGARTVDVSVDGGIKLEQARLLAEHGASVLVAGSAIFGASDPVGAIKQLRAAAASAVGMSPTGSLPENRHAPRVSRGAPSAGPGGLGERGVPPTPRAGAMSGPPVQEDAVHVASGKVRELYALDDERLLIVASDRISTFDVVLPTEIPDKGRVLTGLAAYWFARTREICPNHLLGLRPDGRSSECRRLDMLPLECVVRGYLAGSGWKDYRATGEVCGHRLPGGLRESDRLPDPIFTPATKAQSGHDENITGAQAAKLIGAERVTAVERLAIALYQFAATHARQRGIIIADTKFEFGLDRNGRIVLGDEALTPDSSRFWPADGYAPGGAQPSFDKQFVRDFCEQTAWNKTPPGPELPAAVVAGTRARYVEAFERLTGIRFARYCADPAVVLQG